MGTWGRSAHYLRLHPRAVPPDVLPANRQDARRRFDHLGGQERLLDHLGGGASSVRTSAARCASNNHTKATPPKREVRPPSVLQCMPESKATQCAKTQPKAGCVVVSTIPNSNIPFASKGGVAAN